MRKYKIKCYVYSVVTSIILAYHSSMYVLIYSFRHRFSTNFNISIRFCSHFYGLKGPFINFFYCNLLIKSTYSIVAYGKALCLQNLLEVLKFEEK